MKIKALTCPNCEAAIQADSGREYVFCTYCGEKILLRDLLEIRTEDTTPEQVQFAEKLEEADGLLRMNDYYRAEMIYHELIREFPQNPIGYERMICVFTRDYTIFRADNKERIFSYVEKLLEVASEENKAEYVQLKERLEAAAWQEAEKREDALEMPKIDLKNAQTNGVVITSVCTSVFAFAVALFLKMISSQDQVRNMTDMLSLLLMVFGFAAAGYAVYVKRKND